ncbi:GDSL-type esterase/lipase family protein [Providencia rettgeri]|uniref:GDSL-type esterase/lipase family protein n=1 Tax=Providencia sp. PROV146 TaxID=2949856 RepID=UPI00234A60F6|nr:GDSL-type esterase/lipase family protein [Providencia sp. PROV146]
MAGTIPTKNPVPSKDIRDLGFNSEKMDEVINSEKTTYTDRKGRERLTIKGLESAAVSAGPTVEAAQRAVDQANLAREAAEGVQVNLDSTVNEAKSAASESHKSAESSKISAEMAAASADSIATDARVFDSKDEGIAATNNNDYFKVWSPTESNISFIYYKNENGIARELTSYPSASAVKGVNLLFDAMNEFSSIQRGYANGFNLFNNSRNHKFKSSENIKTNKSVVFIDESFSGGFISKQYLAKDLNIIKGEILYCSMLTYTASAFKSASVIFRKGIEVVSSKLVSSTRSGVEILKIQLLVPLVDFDIIEFRVERAGNDNGLLEIGGFSASYGAFAGFESSDLSVCNGVNLLCDAFNEISSIHPFVPYNWYSKGSIKPKFKNGNFILGESVLSLNGETGRLAKSYDISHLNIKKKSYINVGVSCYVGNGSCKFHAQFMSGSQYLNVIPLDLHVGINEISISDVLMDTPTHINFLFDVQNADNDIEINGFFLSTSDKSDKQSGVVPTSYLFDLLSLEGQREDIVTARSLLRNFNIKTTRLDLAETALLNIAFIGDSWTHDANRYSGPVAKLLAKKYGDAGAGWISFSAYNQGEFLGQNGNIRPDLYKVAYDASSKWVKGIYANCPTPDICTAGSDVVGAKITVNGVRPITKADLLYIPSDGVFDYRFDGGEWVTIDTSSTEAIKKLSLTNLPTSNTWIFELVVKSGLVKVSGMNVFQGNSGVVTHKLGATGSKTGDWAKQDLSVLSESWKTLNLDTAFIMLATNDQNANVSVSDYRSNILSIINALLSANPAIDICLVAPCENQAGNSIKMSLYADALLKIAIERDISYLNLQDSFGDDPSYYAATGANPLFNADKIHPDPTTGGRLISSTIMKYFGAI